MVRFCDKEVSCVEFEALNKKELLEYFHSGHEEDILCVYDSFDTMGYIGIITYRSLERSINLNGAIVADYVILDQDIWENARYYFLHYDYLGFERYALLPVLDENGQLVCFAYEEEEANREIRQLRELSEMPEALQFQDIYPEYKCVKIHEFNELAYFFAKYLKSQGITVQVCGAMWNGIFAGEECQVPDYECLNIYAEGVGVKKRDWKENLLKSVSVEFAYIDEVYEANIKNGIIRDAERNCAELLEWLKDEKEIIILRAEWKEQDAYDFLLGNGIDICCFADLTAAHSVLGKSVLSEAEVRNRYQNPVFINCTEKNSAWGFGGVDHWDYIGYKRNEQYILLRDYVEVPENNLLNALRNAKVALIGNIYLCSRLYDYLKQKMVSVVGYVSISSEDTGLQKMTEFHIEDADEEILYLLVEPEEYYFRMTDLNETITRPTEAEKIYQLIEYIRKTPIENYTDYFSNVISFINIEANEKVKYSKAWLMPKKIVLGSIEGGSGTVFFRGLLDNHPSIILMQFSLLNHNLFKICICLSMVETGEMLPLLWKMIEGGEDLIFNPTAFNEKMSELLSHDSKFTSAELFVMIHIAYMYMCGRNISEDNIRNMIIYWEPHIMDRFLLEDCVRWLETEEIPCDIINVVRNICIRQGSVLRKYIEKGWKRFLKKPTRYYVLGSLPTEKKDYRQSDRLIVKFEDLKCRPREMLEAICNKWDIPWSDTLMATTRCGEEVATRRGVRNFDLAPVYNTYEELFSEYDRLRIMIISAPYERKYGYPYVELAQFSRRELQEMFSAGFRFEELLGAESGMDKLEKKLEVQAEISYRLQKVRMLEFYNNLIEKKI